MTDEEKILLRKENVRRLFQLTGDDFVKEVYEKHRQEDAAPTAEFRAKYDVEENTLFERRWYKIRAKKPAKTCRTEKILHIHGGAFVLESGVAEHVYSAFLSETMGAEVWFPEYPLAPEASAADAIPMVVELYKMMLKETPAEKIAITGSSAGGGVAVSTAMALRAEGLPQPNCLILYSPCIEFSMPETEEDKKLLEILEERDPMISYVSMPTIGELWRGDLAEDDYRWNPIAGSMKGLAPMLIFAGTGEVLNMAAIHFVKRLKEEGAPFRYYEKEMMPHCWILFQDFEITEERSLVLKMLEDPASVIE